MMSALVSDFPLTSRCIFPSNVSMHIAAVDPGSIPKIKYLGRKALVMGFGSRGRNSTLFLTGDMSILKSPARFDLINERIFGRGAYAIIRALA